MPQSSQTDLAQIGVPLRTCSMHRSVVWEWPYSALRHSLGKFASQFCHALVCWLIKRRCTHQSRYWSNREPRKVNEYIRSRCLSTTLCFKVGGFLGETG